MVYVTFIGVMKCEDFFVIWKGWDHLGELGLGLEDNINVDNKAISMF